MSDKPRPAKKHPRTRHCQVKGFRPVGMEPHGQSYTGKGPNPFGKGILSSGPSRCLDCLVGYVDVWSRCSKLVMFRLASSTMPCLAVRTVYWPFNLLPSLLCHAKRSLDESTLSKTTKTNNSPIILVERISPLLATRKNRINADHNCGTTG